MRRNTTSQPFAGGPALCFFLFFIFPFIHYIFNLLLSSAAAFGVKDYRGQIVNAGGLELQRERVADLTLHDGALHSPFPGPLSGWGWDVPAAEARGSGDTSSPIWRCDPSPRLGTEKDKHVKLKSH